MSWADEVYADHCAVVAGEFSRRYNDADSHRDEPTEEDAEGES